MIKVKAGLRAGFVQPDPYAVSLILQDGTHGCDVCAPVRPVLASSPSVRKVTRY